MKLNGMVKYKLGLIQLCFVSRTENRSKVDLMGMEMYCYQFDVFANDKKDSEFLWNTR